MTHYQYDLNEPRGLWQCAKCRNYVLHLFASMLDGRGVCGVCLDEEAASLLEDTDPTQPSQPFVDEMALCIAEPDPHTYCAASWIAFLENYEAPAFVPDGVPTLCAAHLAKLQFDVVRHYGRLDSLTLASVVNARADTIIRAARRQVIRVACRIEDR